MCTQRSPSEEEESMPCQLRSDRGPWKRPFVRGITLVFVVGLILGAYVLRPTVHAQRARTAPPGRDAARPHSAAAPAAKPEATLIQLMRGVMYPASNVVFAAQDDLGKQPPAPHPSVSPNPLTTTYGGWQAVENAALAIYETAGLIEM